MSQLLEYDLAVSLIVILATSELANSAKQDLNDHGEQNVRSVERILDPVYTVPDPSGHDMKRIVSRGMWLLNLR